MHSSQWPSKLRAAEELVFSLGARALWASPPHGSWTTRGPGTAWGPTTLRELVPIVLRYFRDAGLKRGRQNRIGLAFCTHPSKHADRDAASGLRPSRPPVFLDGGALVSGERK
ncbi:hypothetical protein VM1G_11401 [Cytospora mali]|uniref:Uncharacterized protein n=1 Tax=Cytospora mali TaxID=578113 RepID=A0A194VRW0_CYTMA|nr:hypothetical protein VM1G_11400 [Valsa mali]KUI66673.1 hypothetical protein VM1G_11401 [Valsa mali]